jgi:hypothetical protein
MLIITIRGCKKCEKLKKEVKNLENVNIIYLDCDDSPTDCENLEAITNTLTYPIVLANQNRKNLSTNNTKEIYYLAESYEDFKLLNEEKSGYILKPQRSLEQMIEVLKQIKYTK